MNNSTIYEQLKEEFFEVCPLVFDVFLLIIYIIRVFHQKNHQQVFGRRTASTVLDMMYTLMLVVLVMQGALFVVMYKRQNSFTSGDFCSVLNFTFQLLQTALKVLSCSVMFQLHYIWVKQKALNYLNSNQFHNRIIKHVFVFFLSFSVVTCFKTNIDVAFVLKDGVCLGKKLIIHKTLTQFSRYSAFSVFNFLVLVQVYYLCRTGKEKIRCFSRNSTSFKLPSSENDLSLSNSLKQSTDSNFSIRTEEKIDIVFGLIYKQIISFIKVLVSILVVFILKVFSTRYFKLENSDDIVEFSVANYFLQHAFSFLVSFILCIYRFFVSKLSIQDQYLNIKHKIINNSIC